MKTSPTQRALKELRKLGYVAQVVERWNPYARVRIDLFGGIDVIGVKPGCQILGVQATSGTNHAARVSKLRGEPQLAAWVQSGGQLEVWSFAKKGPRGKRKTWELRRERIEFFTAETT